MLAPMGVATTKKVDQINVRLTTEERRVLERAVLALRTSYGAPSIGKFLLISGLAAAERLLRGDKAA